MRGRTQSGRGSFWTWRDSMYDVANGLDPESYYHLAKAVYSEMALAGIGVVGEFHYVHHQPGGALYDNRNAMSEALVSAATEVGIRITMLDTLYLHGGLDRSGYFPLRSEQERFSDRTAAAWLKRRDRWSLPEHRLVRLGAAAHSIRAVDPNSITQLQDWATEHDAPLHIHVSEQPAENKACLKFHQATPVEILHQRGLLAPNVTVIHATHLSDSDIKVLGDAATICCFCPTTERDLADGIGPSTKLLEAGAEICLGSDSHAVIDLFEEARALELNERLSTLRRGNHRVSDLLVMATSVGYRSLGWPDGGRLEAGALADFITVDLESVRTAGTPPGPEIVFSAAPADVTNVVVAGETIVSPGSKPKIDWAAALNAQN
jgi:formiminoglutamate deiminase